MTELFTTGHWYYYARLSSQEKKTYQHLYDGLKKRCPDITFPVEKTDGNYPTGEQILDVLLCVLWDNPAMYYVDATNVQIYTDTSKGFGRITYTEYFPKDQSAQIEQVLRHRVDALLESLYEQAEGHPQLFKLYCYMIANLRYMEDINKDNTLKNLEARTILGPLLNRLGVCAGYTKTFKLICDQLGISCFYISGSAKGAKGWGNHGWNVVYLDGAFYHVDVTFDYARYRSTGKISTAYFLRGDEKMLEDHRWDRNKFPVMVEDYL